MSKDNEMNRMVAKTNDLVSQGLDKYQAMGIANLEERFHNWTGKHDELSIVLYGDFDPPSSTIIYTSLGITVYPEKLKKTNTGALTNLRATVKINGINLPSIIDASKRINLLLGTFTILEWGACTCGWRSYLTHGFSSCRGAQLPDEDSVKVTSKAVLNLREDVRRKIEAVFYWLRDPHSLLLDYKSDSLRVYSYYWNAFECIVEAVDLEHPRTKLSRPEKQDQIDKLLTERKGRLTIADIRDCYFNIVDPGFVNKAMHALEICLKNESEYYINECFKCKPKNKRLYNIRNDINHGNVDAQDPHEIIRIEGRQTELTKMIWKILDRLLPFARKTNSKNI